MRPFGRFQKEHMKDIIEFCKSKIDQTTGPINELLKKHGCRSTMELMRMSEIPEEDVRTAIKLIHVRDSYLTIVNTLGSAYTEGIYPDDPDSEAKRRALYSVSGHVLEHILKPGAPTWEKMDSIPADRVTEMSIQCIMAGELEYALLGLVYTIYQRKFQQTNRADKMLEQLYLPGPTEKTTPPDDKKEKS
jgi:hypothetical protein